MDNEINDDDISKIDQTSEDMASQGWKSIGKSLLDEGKQPEPETYEKGQAIEPEGSPIDLLAGPIGSKLGSVASKGLMSAGKALAPTVERIAGNEVGAIGSDISKYLPVDDAIQTLATNSRPTTAPLSSEQLQRQKETFNKGSSLWKQERDVLAKKAKNDALKRFNK